MTILTISRSLVLSFFLSLFTSFHSVSSDETKQNKMKERDVKKRYLISRLLLLLLLHFPRLFIFISILLRETFRCCAHFHVARVTLGWTCFYKCAGTARCYFLHLKKEEASVCLVCLSVCPSVCWLLLSDDTMEQRDSFVYEQQLMMLTRRRRRRRHSSCYIELLLRDTISEKEEEEEEEERRSFLLDVTFHPWTNSKGK